MSAPSLRITRLAASMLATSLIWSGETRLFAETSEIEWKYPSLTCASIDIGERRESDLVYESSGLKMYELNSGDLNELREYIVLDRVGCSIRLTGSVFKVSSLSSSITSPDDRPSSTSYFPHALGLVLDEIETIVDERCGEPNIAEFGVMRCRSRSYSRALALGGIVYVWESRDSIGRVSQVITYKGLIRGYGVIDDRTGSRLADKILKDTEQ